MAVCKPQDNHYQTIEDICAHVGDDYAQYMGAIVPPIFQNSLFIQPTEANGLADFGYVYTRSSNPTIEVAERKIAALEGAEAAACFSSGMGAISAAIMHFVRKDCHVVLLRTAYGPARSFISGYLAEKFGVTCTLVDGNDIHEIEQALRPETTLIYLESPSSMTFQLQDLEAVANLAKAHSIGTIIDNTYATPLHQNPLRYGIDLVCHTASKYLGGHSDIVAGVIAGSAERIQSICNSERSLIGAIMDPHQASLLTRGIRTLPVRLKQHGENGMTVAKHLEQHPCVERVFYPGLDSHPQKDLVEKYLSGTNGLLSFVYKGTAEQAKAFINALTMFQHGCSWGGFESLVVSITIGASEESSRESGLPANLIRLHVGLECVDTLIADIDHAFEVSQNA